jgi:hypothetical protein
MASKLYMRVALYLAWLAAAGAGAALVMKYESAAGSAGATPRHWSSAAQISLERDRATLLMFAHPHCPCTRASIGELNRLLARCEGKVAAHVLFLQPSDFADDWAHTDSWRSAAAIPGVSVHDDRDGQLARRFGAETSGFVVLYDAGGELLFKGGITAARGQAGDNTGANLIVSFLEQKRPSLEQTPVYGCGLLNQCAASTDDQNHAPSSN